MTEPETIQDVVKEMLAMKSHLAEIVTHNKKLSSKVNKLNTTNEQLHSKNDELIEIVHRLSDENEQLHQQLEQENQFRNNLITNSATKKQTDNAESHRIANFQPAIKRENENSQVK